MDPAEITPPEFKKDLEAHNRQEAVGLIRNKLDALYASEPDAEKEADEVSHLNKKKLSRHQKFMQDLTASGLPPHQVQAKWHEYYQSLSEVGKHEVWKEFYDEQAKKKSQEKLERQQAERREAELLEESKLSHSSHPKHKKKPHKSPDSQTTVNYTAASHKPSHRSKIHKIRQNHHFRSLMFGFSMGLTVIFILLFSFFNERFLVPFIRPSGNVSATPIIIDPSNTGPVGKDSKIIIPKINVEAPLVFDVKTLQEDDIQEGLQRGVVHYPSTAMPGETGNSVIFGHSSGNILNKGSYKFAFLLLKSLENGDTFIVQHNGKRYVYKVYNEFVTTPNDFSVLEPTDRKAVTTLITCDPPGTSSNRLIVQAEQIFPDPATNKKAKTQNIPQAEQLPSNSKSLWARILDWF